jgi:transcriptional regulator with XRE-family HTH domain
MTTDEVLQALDRYAKESNQSDRKMATQLGMSRMMLSDWLRGKDQPQKCVLARLAGFLRGVGYL